MAFKMLCQYANLSIGVRHGVYIQGIVVLSGAGLMIHSNEYLLSLLTGCFCLAMTIVLQILHIHYNQYFFSVREYIRYLERSYATNRLIGYVSFVETERDRRVKGKRLGWLKNHGSFALIGLSSIGIIASNSIELLSRCHCVYYHSCYHYYATFINNIKFQIS